jgi:hypothetical protein
MKTTHKKSIPDFGEYLTVQEVADLRAVSKTTIHNWMERGLAHENLFGRIVIQRADAEAFEPGPVGQPRCIDDAMISAARKRMSKGEGIKSVALEFGVKPGSLWAALRRAKIKAKGAKS